MIEILYYLSLFTLLITLFYTSGLDFKDRRVPFKNWKPLIIVGTISTITYIYLNYSSFDLMTNCVLITTVIVFYVMGHFKFYGGADALCLIFITIFGITIPFNPILNNIYTGIGMTTYINAYIIYVLTWVGHKYLFDKERGVPFIVFITLGFIVGILVGDIYELIIGVIL